MTPEEQEEAAYRFSGYNLPMIQLDETGLAYYVVQPHPYYYNQPQYWQKPFFNRSDNIIFATDLDDVPDE